MKLAALLYLIVNIVLWLDEYCAVMDWKSMWIKGGRIEEVAWIDRDVIAWHSGVHVIFFHLIDGKQILFPCSHFSDGVCCISGHPTKHLVVFAEKSRNPRILVYSYPNMTKVSECCNGIESGYLATAFGFSKYLISLGSCPDYPIIIWNWKNGEKLSSISTPIHDLHGQMIRVCPNQLMSIGQLGKDSKTLLIWSVTTIRDIVMSYEKVILPNEASATYIDWSSHRQHPELAIVDENGNVYISNMDGTEINRVVLSQRCAVCLDYEIPIVCWFQDGIMLKTTFCQMRYYKKNPKNNWKREQYITSEFKPYIITLNPFKINEIFYFTEEGYLMQMNLSITEEPTLTVNQKFYNGGIYKFIDFIYPWAHDFVVMDKNFNLNIVDVINGEFIGKLNVKLEGEVTQLLSHPDYPLVIFITTSGELFVITVHRRDDPSVLYNYRLRTDQLDILKFSQCGKHLIAGEKTSGDCFCFTFMLENKFLDIHQLEIKRGIADVVLYEDAGVIKVIVLILSSTTPMVGNSFLIYELLPNEENFTQASIIIRLPAFYQYIYHAPCNNNVLVTSPHQSREIHYFKCTSDMKMELMKCETTTHRIRGINIHTNRQHLCTSGTDGFVTIFMGEVNSETPAVLLTHHRADLGVVRAICSPCGRLVIALGQNGVVVCSELRSNWKSHFSDIIKREEIILADYASLNKSIFAILSSPCEVFPSETDNATTWVEWKNAEIFMREEGMCREKKLAIRTKLEAIKTEIRQMLDENEKCDERERLPVAEFDLAIFAREQKIKLAREEREEVRLQLEFECASMEKVAQWIKTTFWDPLTTLPKSVFSIYTDYKVTNYPTIPEDPQEAEMSRWCESLNDSKIEVKHVPPEMERCLLIKNRYRPTRLGEESILESLLVDDDQYDDEEEREIEQHAVEGVTTRRFIQPSSSYSQFQDYNFSQFLLMTRDINHDIQELKNYFNKLFEDMYDEKKQVVASLCESNKKIHHIDSELKLLFNESVPETLPDPVWHIEENPESIIHVSDDEVMANLGNSVAQEEPATNEVYDENRYRSQLITNEFYEKKLFESMDGVLEVTWVDIIKKDITKPQCMLTKSPDQYTVEEILAVQKYDNDVQILMKEREKYRRILENDFSKIMTTMREDVEKFDSSLRELKLTKLKVESAIQQLDLLRTRGYLRASQQLTILQDISDCQPKIDENKQRIEKIVIQNNALRLLLQDSQSQREVLLSEEKLMVEQVIMEFRSLGKVTIEILKKQYKRKPKLSLKNIAADDLLELGSCVVTLSKSNFLCRQCAEYLTELDAMDVPPTDLPDIITSNHWSQLIKVRRKKLGLEMRLRANSMEVNAIDWTITHNIEKIGKFQRYITQLEDELSQLNKKQLEFDLDSEIQLVLKMGQVEIDLTGHRNDTANSILLPRQEIVKINDKILQAGEGKLNIIKKKMKFSTGRLLEEWKHKCLKMKIADLEDDLREIRNFPVSKYVRAYLRGQAHTLEDDNINQEIEKRHQAVKMNLDKTLKESLMKLNKLEAKIDKTGKDNHALDEAITRMNVRRWELELERDLEAEDCSREFITRKMVLVRQRSDLISKIQQQYTINLALQTEYELLRLKTVPIESSFRVLSDKSN